MRWSVDPKRKRFRIEKVARCKKTGRLYRPSFPDDYDQGKAFAEAWLGTGGFYFRRIERIRRTWPLRDYWRDTGEVWEPVSGEFDLLSNKEAAEWAVLGWRKVSVP